MKFFYPRVALLCLLISVISVSSFASESKQQTNKAPFHVASYQWTSGYLDGHRDSVHRYAPDASHVVEMSGATWLQLDFKGTVLGQQDSIEITGIKDGFTQRLDHKTLKQWGYRSAFFNGDALSVKFFIGKKTRNAVLHIPAVKVGEYADEPETLCGVDDRVASNDSRVARIDPIGCTGWVISNGKLLTAGHCLAGSGNTTLSFNPPASLPDGTVQFPAPHKQYAINQGSFNYAYTGIGNDWGLFRVYNNSVTGLQPKAAQGAFYIRQDLNPAQLRITGFGVDSGTTNQTNQTEVGPNNGSSGTVLRYVTDTMGGNSGSPVIDAATGRAVGIHTNGGCNSNGSGNNYGTSFFNAGLWSAIGKLSQSIVGTSEAGDNFGSALAKGDFDGDGYDDLAIGVPHEAIGSITAAGAVNVIYGSVVKLNRSNNQMWHQNVPSIAGGAEANDHFGYSVASGDFNRDGYDDLAIGVPGESIGAIGNAGAVNIIYGSSLGLTGSGDQLWHQNSPGIKGGAEAWDQLGFSLVSGDFDDDGYDDLAIGVPGEDIGSINSAGAVNIIYGSVGGLTASGDQLWQQNSSGIAGGAESYDRFGYALSSGDFDHDGYDDLAIGVPYEDIGSISNAGAVNVIYGASSGLSAAGDQLWHQNSGGIKGAAEANDLFGYSLSSGDYDGDGRADLAAGVPGESVGSIAAAGAVNVIYGTNGGLGSVNDQLWHQNSSGIKGAAERGDRFGYALGSGDFNNNGRDDLAVGVPRESVGALANAGAVNVLYGQAAGLSAAGDQLWYQNSSGILGGSEVGDLFARSLVAGDFNGDGRDALAIGVPGESIGAINNAGAVNVIYANAVGLTAAGDQIWHQNQ